MANIIIVSPESWSHIFISKHHYALELARRGHRVFFLNPPDSKNYKSLHFENIIEQPGIIVVSYPGQLKGLRFFPSFVRIWLNKLFLKKLEKKANCRMDVIWNFENSRFYDLHFAGDRLKIYHQVDLNQDFHVKETALSANICFCTTDFIISKILQFNCNVHKIHHGFSICNFQMDQDSLKTDMCLNDNKTQAVYVGNLDSFYLDLNTLEYVIEQNNDVKFTFVGPYSKDKEFYRSVSLYENVVLVGPVPAQYIPAYLKSADILLLIYKAEKYREQLASPHKMMEYLASGKVIVSSYTDEYKDKTELLLMANSQSEIPELFARAKNNLDVFNSIEQMNSRINFALDHTYARQLDRIENLLITSTNKSFQPL